MRRCSSRRWDGDRDRAKRATCQTAGPRSRACSREPRSQLCERQQQYLRNLRVDVGLVTAQDMRWSMSTPSAGSRVRAERGTPHETHVAWRRMTVAGPTSMPSSTRSSRKLRARRCDPPWRTSNRPSLRRGNVALRLQPRRTVLRLAELDQLVQT